MNKTRLNQLIVWLIVMRLRTTIDPILLTPLSLLFTHQNTSMKRVVIYTRRFSTHKNNLIVYSNVTHNPLIQSELINCW